MPATDPATPDPGAKATADAAGNASPSPARSKRSALKTRLAIGLPLIVTVLGLLVVDWWLEVHTDIASPGVPVYPFFAVMVMVAAVGTVVEVRRMLTIRGWATLPWHVFLGVMLMIVGTVAGTVTAVASLPTSEALPGTAATRRFLMAQAFYGGAIMFTIGFLGVVWVWVSALWTGGAKRRDHEARAQAAIGSTFILTTIAVPFSLAFLLRSVPGYGFGLVLLAVLASRMGDVGAYFTGRALGRHKLIVAVSPKKTIEGTVGGLIVSGLVAMAIGAIFPLHGVLPGVWLPVAGVLVGGAAQIADLLASALKRWAGVKDSSNLIPEFGGLLDLCDGFLFSIPMLYGLILFRAAITGMPMAF